MKRSLVAFLPLGLWAAAVLTVGSLKLEPTSLPLGADKAAHFVMYGVGGALAAWAGRTQGRGWAAFIGLALVLLTGAADELRQATVPGRDSELMDWVADATGALLLFIVFDRLLKRK